MTDLVSLVQSLIGTWVPASGDVANIDLPYLTACILFLMVMWFLFKLVLRLIGGRHD